MRGRPIKFFLCVVTSLAFASLAGAQGNESLAAVGSAILAPTPPMGWNSWNSFGIGVSEGLLRQTADALVSSGMRDLGYRYVTIDDGWALHKRIQGHLVPDPAKFPHGLKSLGDYLHSRGLQFGIYSDSGVKTCNGQMPGSYGYEAVDAADFARWGVDYLKYDNCNTSLFSSPKADYRRMARAIAATGRPMVFSICAWEFKKWMPQTGQLWRTTGDIKDNWDRILNIIDWNEEWAAYAGPGRWNDPDMLVVGCYGVPDLQHGQVLDDGSEWRANTGLTETENRSHFSMWAMMAAPLIAGNDVRAMTPAVLDILTNREVIAVDQDPLGRQAVKVWDNGQGLNVYSRVLTGANTRAVALLNRTNNSEAITAWWKDIGIPPGGAKVRDLWKHSEMGVFNDSFTATVSPHEVVLLKITGNQTP